MSSSKTLCGKCGFRVANRARFCGRCGSADLATPEDRSDITLSDFVECSSCNAFREADGDFCEHCGARVEVESEAQIHSSPEVEPIQLDDRKTGVPRLLLVGIIVLGGLTLIPVFTLLIAKSLGPAATTNQNKQSGSPTPSPPESHKGMVLIPGGEFIMGDDNGDEFERPAHRVRVKSFFMDQREVTCAEYEQFLKATSRTPPPGWSRKVCPAGFPDLPATGVNWFDATDYARWRNARLPTEEEWEYAARANEIG